MSSGEGEVDEIREAVLGEPPVIVGLSDGYSGRVIGRGMRYIVDVGQVRTSG